MGLPSPEQLEELYKIFSSLELRIEARDAIEEAADEDIPGHAVFGGLQRSPSSNHMGYWNLEKQNSAFARLGTKAAPTPQVRAPVTSARPARATVDEVQAKAKKVANVGAPAALAAPIGHALPSGLPLISTSIHVGGSVAVPIALTLAPVGQALSAWISVAVVAVQAGKVFDLYTLRDDARSPRRSRTTYYCNCHECADNIQYIIDKKERNVGIMAVSVGTGGLVAIGKLLHSLTKSIKSSVNKEIRPKEKVSRAIVQSARTGCLAAAATVFLLSGSWTNGYRDRKTMEAAVTTLTVEDGWKKFKENW